jgi:hypothetical protein
MTAADRMNLKQARQDWKLLDIRRGGAADTVADIVADSGYSTCVQTAVFLPMY